MRLFNLKMSDTQKLQIDDLSKTLGVTSSTLIRALLFDGVKRTAFQASKDTQSTADSIKLLDAKAKL